MIRNLLKEKIPVSMRKVFLWIGAHFIITLLLFEHDHYSSILSLISMVVATISSMDLFDLKPGKALFISTLCCLVMAIPDLIVSFIIVNIKNLSSARNNILLMSITSILNCAITVSIFQIPIIKKFLSKTVKNKEPFQNRKIVTYSILIFFVVGMLYYLLANIYALKVEYIISCLAIIIFIVLSFIYSKDRSEYETLVLEYDVLYKCIQEFEEWIEQAQLNIHEYKNQIAKILDITDDEKVLKIVNKMIKNTEKIDEDMLEQLKNIPKGGIKGLLYYKMIRAKNKKITVGIDIGKGIEKLFRRLKEEDQEDLSKLIGIYIDNAIEAVEKEKKRKIYIEIYQIKDTLQFVFSNPVEGRIETENIYQKGISSKGIGRGNGLYFASKIIKSNPKFEEKHYQINDFYFQKILIHTKKEK